MSGGGGSTTTQKADPWSGVQPGLKNLYNNAGAQFAQGGPQVYQGNGVSPLNANQNQALGAMANIANGGLGVLNGYQANALNLNNNIAQGSDFESQYLSGMMQGNGPSGTALQQILNGSNGAVQGLTQQMNGQTNPEQALLAMLRPGYTNPANDPGLQAAMNAANHNTTRTFQTAVMPSIASQFSSAGRFGSGAQSQGVSDANNNLATQISGTNAQLANSAW